jgi:hypothetical protein
MYMSRNTQNDECFHVEFWRKRFNRLRKDLKGRSIIKSLIDGNSYFDSAEGGNVYRNVLAETASLDRTRIAVNALETHLAKHKKVSVRRTKVSAS